MAWREAVARTHAAGFRVVTASDARAYPQRRAIFAAFRRVTAGLNPRDGLLRGRHAVNDHAILSSRNH